MTYKKEMIEKLAIIMSQHRINKKGQGEDPLFYLLKEEIVKKLGKIEFERMYNKAKRKSVELIEKAETNV